MARPTGQGREQGAALDRRDPQSAVSIDVEQCILGCRLAPGGDPYARFRDAALGDLKGARKTAGGEELKNAGAYFQRADYGRTGLLVPQSRARQRDNALFFFVRVTLGHHWLRGAGDCADYSYLLLPSSDFLRHLTVSNRHDNL